MAGKEDFDPSTLNLWLPSPPSSSLISAETRIDWKETPEAHVFKADLPGFRIEEVRVEIEDGRVLQISGERNVEKLDENETWHRVERSSRKFMRRFQLPENANLEQLKAAVENGVLTVTVSRQDAKTPSIEISSVKDSPAKLIYLPCGCVERELNPEDSPFSEEEIRDVLLASLTPLTIKDLLAIFKPRLNTREDMHYFVDTLSKISNLQKSSGSDYVVLKEVFVVPISDSNC